MTAPDNVMKLGEVWMLVRNHEKLARLMEIQNVSQRELARCAGWKSHSYLGRLIRGEVRSLDTEPALRIAYRLGVAADDLFLTKVSSKAVVQRKSRNLQRGAAA